MAMRRAKKRGWKLIVVDPRRTEMSKSADLHLQVRPGEDPTLLAGMLRVILDEDRHDAEFCDRWVDGLAELHAAVRPFGLDHVAERDRRRPVDDIVARRPDVRRRPAGHGDVWHRARTWPRAARSPSTWSTA